MKHLFPALSSAKANVGELERLRESQTQLEMQGIHPDPSLANFPLLTAKMAPKEIAALKQSFPRQGFVQEIEAMEDEAKAFAAEFSGKGAAAPSQAWKLLHSAKPESVLWVAHTSKSSGIQAKFKGFFSEWSQARQKLPYGLMQEMRIVPELPGYHELLDKLFFELMDSRLGTTEEMKAFLEPYSPPAPPPPVHLRRPRLAKKDAKPAKSRKKAAVESEGNAEAATASEVEAQQPEAPVAAKPVKAALGKPAVAVKPVAIAAKSAAPAKIAEKASPKQQKPVQKKPAEKVSAKTTPKKAPVKIAAKTPAKKVVTKKAPAKAPAKTSAKKAVAAKAPAKAALKKVAAPSKKPIAPPKKSAAKKSTSKKVPAKKALPKPPHKKGR
jgi:hypothetical protein